MEHGADIHEVFLDSPPRREVPLVLQVADQLEDSGIVQHARGGQFEGVVEKSRPVQYGEHLETRIQ